MCENLYVTRNSKKPRIQGISREDMQEWLDRQEPEKPFLPATYLNHHQIQEIFKIFWYDYFTMIQELDTEQKESEEELQKASALIQEGCCYQASQRILGKCEELPFLSLPVHDKPLNQLHQLDLRCGIKIEHLDH
ncbi:uncharacterized protein LOC143252950 isoform X2 [Tachypleus tridentatus]|uniref:uncharacterized protein LOC143252950 isoform X2 n=1 Tax=Tachypleus tridentatus TaxID=6853 RepID=UPI003FD1C9B6